MRLAFEILKPHLLRIFLFLALTAWAFFASYEVMRRKDHVLLIGIDQNGTRIIKENHDPILKTELVNFLKNYFEKAYQFTPQNFLENVGDATSYLSDTFWQKEKDQFFKLKEIVHTSQISQTYQLKKLHQIDPESYQALIEVTQKSRLKTETFLLKLSLHTHVVSRSEKNPWGIEITQVLEEKQ